MRQRFVAGDHQRNAEFFAVIEQPVAQGQIKQTLLPIIESLLAARAVDFGKRRKGGGLHHFPRRVFYGAASVQRSALLGVE